MIIFNGSATRGKEIDGIFGVTNDANLTTSRFLAQGAAVFDAVIHGRDTAFLYTLDVEPNQVKLVEGMPSESMIQLSEIPLLAPAILRLIQNFRPSTIVEPSRVPQAYREGSYARDQKTQVEICIQHGLPTPDFGFTYLPPNTVVSIEKVPQYLIELAREQFSKKFLFGIIKPTT
jgi:hypothetical protein